MQIPCQQGFALKGLHRMQKVMQEDTQCIAAVLSYLSYGIQAELICVLSPRGVFSFCALVISDLAVLRE